MATKKTATTKTQDRSPGVAEAAKISKLRKKYATIRIDIKAGREKNTNAHKKIKKQIAQLLTNQK